MIVFDYDDKMRILVVRSDSGYEPLPNYTATDNIALRYPDATSIHVDGSVYIDAGHGAYAFAGGTQILDIAFQTKVESVPPYMCDGCRSLYKIQAEPMSSVGDYAFRNTAFNDWSASFSRTDTVGVEAFSGCQFGKIESDWLKSVGAGAFKNNRDLTYVSVASITSLPDEIFSGCSIRNISVPFTIESVGSEAFANNPLEYIQFQGETPPRCANDAFLNCPMSGIAGLEGAIFVPRSALERYKSTFPENYVPLISYMPTPGPSSLWIKSNGHWELMVKDYSEEIDEVNTRINGLQDNINQIAYNKQDRLEAGDGIVLSGNYIYAQINWRNLIGYPIDNYEMQVALSQKQNNLRAGTGIILVDNEISTNITWGNIGGIIHNQTDLIGLFENKQNKAFSGTVEPSDVIGSDGDIYVRYAE